MQLSQKQCEAFADILVLAMCIDGHFSLLEEEEIEKKISSIGWDEKLSQSIHIGASIARARDVAGSTDQVRAYVESLVPVIGDEATKQFIFNETKGLIDSDGTHADEATFLIQLKAILKV